MANLLQIKHNVGVLLLAGECVKEEAAPVTGGEERCLQWVSFRVCVCVCECVCVCVCECERRVWVCVCCSCVWTFNGGTLPSNPSSSSPHTLQNHPGLVGSVAPGRAALAVAGVIPSRFLPHWMLWQCLLWARVRTYVLMHVCLRVCQLPLGPCGRKSTRKLSSSSSRSVEVHWPLALPIVWLHLIWRKVFYFKEIRYWIWLHIVCLCVCPLSPSHLLHLLL